MLTQDEAQKLAKKVLGMSTFPECQVTITSQEQAYTRFANNGITTASLSACATTLSIVTTRDARTGSYATNDLDDDSLRAAVKKAEELAALTPPNSERLSPVGPQQFPKTFDFDERTANAALARNDSARENDHRCRDEGKAGRRRSGRALASYDGHRQQSRRCSDSIIPAIRS